MINRDSEIVKMGEAFDDRGSVKFLNSMNFETWKRFYIVQNNQVGFIRAWHGHQIEAKLLVVLTGSILVGTLALENFQTPDKSLVPKRLVMHANANQALFIPAGNVNGFKTLTPDARVMFLSSSTLEQSKTDDFRFTWDYWNIWDIEYR